MGIMAPKMGIQKWDKIQLDQDITSITSTLYIYYVNIYIYIIYYSYIVIYHPHNSFPECLPRSPSQSVELLFESGRSSRVELFAMVFRWS